MGAAARPPYLEGAYLVPEKVGSFSEYPFCLPWVRDFDLTLSAAVTFVIGENGSGKTTLVEALAVLAGLPASGGSRNERGANHGPKGDSPLAHALRPRFRKRPRDAYFFRGEYSAYFASLLDARRSDPLFRGDPYARYGGGSLHARSHGEGFLDVMVNRIEDGLYFLDEPEAASFAVRRARREKGRHAPSAGGPRIRSEGWPEGTPPSSATSASAGAGTSPKR
jgi:predicted ATPase